MAVSVGDRETALAQLRPGATDLGEGGIFGRAHTLESQFDWYEAVGFVWTLDQCVEAGEAAVDCTVTGSNAWSDALGVEPITGAYVVEFEDGGITSIVEKDDSFISQWSPLVFEVFAGWVETHHPADAPMMWNESDVTPGVP